MRNILGSAVELRTKKLAIKHSQLSFVLIKEKNNGKIKCACPVRLLIEQRSLWLVSGRF